MIVKWIKLAWIGHELPDKLRTFLALYVKESYYPSTLLKYGTARAATTVVALLGMNLLLLERKTTSAAASGASISSQIFSFSY